MASFPPPLLINKDIIAIWEQNLGIIALIFLNQFPQQAYDIF